MGGRGTRGAAKGADAVAAKTYARAAAWASAGLVAGVVAAVGQKNYRVAVEAVRAALKVILNKKTKPENVEETYEKYKAAIKAKIHITEEDLLKLFRQETETIKREWAFGKTYRALEKQKKETIKENINLWKGKIPKPRKHKKWPGTNGGSQPPEGIAG